MLFFVSIIAGFFALATVGCALWFLLGVRYNEGRWEDILPPPPNDDASSMSEGPYDTPSIIVRLDRAMQKMRARWLLDDNYERAIRREKHVSDDRMVHLVKLKLLPKDAELDPARGDAMQRKVYDKPSLNFRLLMGLGIFLALAYLLILNTYVAQQDDLDCYGCATRAQWYTARDETVNKGGEMKALAIVEFFLLILLAAMVYILTPIQFGLGSNIREDIEAEEARQELAPLAPSLMALPEPDAIQATVQVTIPLPLGMRFDAVDNFGCFVTLVRPNSNAQQSGRVHAGQRVDAINENEVLGLQSKDVTDLIKRSPNGQVTLTLTTDVDGYNAFVESRNVIGGTTHGAKAPPAGVARTLPIWQSMDATRSDAEAFVVTAATDGIFVVRPSSRSSSGMSLTWGHFGRAGNISINKGPSGKYTLTGSQQEHPSLQAIITHHHRFVTPGCSLQTKLVTMPYSSHIPHKDHIIAAVERPLGMQFDVVPNHGPFITLVKEGGNAKQSNLPNGARLVAVDGIALAGMDKKAIAAVIKTGQIPGSAARTEQAEFCSMTVARDPKGRAAAFPGKALVGDAHSPLPVGARDAVVLPDPLQKPVTVVITRNLLAEHGISLINMGTGNLVGDVTPGSPADTVRLRCSTLWYLFALCSVA